ncbi:hypothetical protein [Halobacteriovorax sp.]|uniref:hypothetical protein n=1 Tax=Halobacteriovorax sp. TaxID=2020862 RepID=UPI003AF2FB75
MDLLEKVEGILNESEHRSKNVVDETLIYFGDNYNKTELDLNEYSKRLLKISLNLFQQSGVELTTNILKSCRENEILNAIKSYQFFAAEIVKLSSGFKYLEKVNLYVTPTALSLRLFDCGVSNEIVDEKINNLVRNFNVNGVAIAKYEGETGSNKLIIKLNYKNLERVNKIFNKKEVVCDGII